MADDTTLPLVEGTSIIVAADEIGGVKYQRIKQGFGVDGSYVDVSSTNPLPVVDAANNTALQDGTQKSQLMGAAKGGSVALAVTATGAGADKTLLDCILRNTDGSVASLGGGGGSSGSTIGSAVPTSATPSGFTDGANLQFARVFDQDTGAGVEYVQGVSLRIPGSGGSVAGGTATNPLRVDPTGTTTQPVSGTVTANISGSVPVTGAFFQSTQPVSIASSVAITAASLPLPTGAAADATLTGGTAKSITRGGAKGTTTAADVTSTASGANHNALDVVIYDTAGNPITSFGGGATASELHLGEVGGRTRTVSVVLTRPADTTAYAAGDQIADSTSSPTILTFTGAARINNGSFRITEITLLDEANQTTKLDADLFIFDNTFTPNNDNAAWAPSAADMEKCKAVVSFRGTNAIVANSAAGASGSIFYPSVSNSIGMQAPSGSTAFFGALVSRNAYTPVSGEKFQIRATVEQD